ncbi:MAG: hypothetical protein M3131_01960 [Actinomycetota bacterium]|nr:hypothetical protein [Actinomycetota bacterium]
MESYEQKSDQAESQVDRLEDEGERVGRRIEEAKSDVQSKQGQPGMELEEDAADPAEAADEGDEPNTTTVD